MSWRAKGDHYYRLAKASGYRSRAAFKLLEAIKVFKLIGPDDVVVDLGCAPGSWLQVAREVVGPGGFVLGVDLKPVEPLGFDNVKVLTADVLSDSVLEAIRAELPREADVLLSDMAPSLTGVRELDHVRQIELARRALWLAKGLLRPSGKALVKASQGSLFGKLLSAFKRSFRIAKPFKPKASRPESPEIYIVGLGFRGTRRLRARGLSRSPAPA